LERFAFVERQKKNFLLMGMDFSDLTSCFTIPHKMFVAVEFKSLARFSSGYGQMDLYVAITGQLRMKTDNPTIGIILCSEKNETDCKNILC